MKEKELKLKSDITHLKEKNELLERKLAALGQNNEQTLVNIQKLRSENEQLQSKLSQTIIYHRDSLDIQEDIKVCSAEWKTTEENMTAPTADLTNQLAQEKLHKRQDDSFRKLETSKLEALTMELNSKDEELHRRSVVLEEVKQQRKRDIDFKDQELRRLCLELDETKEHKKRDIAAKDEELCKVMMELADEKSTKRENERLRDQIKTLQSEMNSIDGKLRFVWNQMKPKQQKKGEIVRGKQGESSGMGAPMKEMHTFDCDSVPDVDRYHERDDCLIVPGYVQDLDKH